MPEPPQHLLPVADEAPLKATSTTAALETMSRRLGGLDKTTLSTLVMCIGLLLSRADSWWAGMVRDDETAIARAVDSRIDARAAAICKSQVDILRGEVTDAQKEPPTVNDISEKLRDHQMRVWRIEERLRMGEWQREREGEL